MTADNGMDVSPSWQELKDERDALAAALSEIKRVRSIPRSDFKHDGRRFQLLAEAIDESPDASLARQKAQWQAEALEVAAEDDWSDTDMLLRAAELRRQAEEES